MDWKLRLGERLVFAFNLIFIIGLAVIFSFVEGGRLELFSDAGLKWIYLLQFIGVLGAVGTLLILYNAFRAWTGSQYKIWGKLRATLFALACLGFLWFAFAANMYHFTSTY